MAPRAIITGAAGLIGQYFVRNGSRWAPGWEVHGLSRADLDLTDSSAAERLWRAIKPDAVIHCAAMSRTKDCEQHPELARGINVEATAHLVRLSKDIPFIFYRVGRSSTAREAGIGSRTVRIQSTSTERISLKLNNMSCRIPATRRSGLS